MTEDEKDWNAYFAQRVAAHRAARAERLADAKEQAPADKEPFDAERYRALYQRRNAIGADEHTPWDTLLAEAEYDYYVTHPEHLSLEAFLAHQIWLQGWG